MRFISSMLGLIEWYFILSESIMCSVDEIANTSLKRNMYRDTPSDNDNF